MAVIRGATRGGGVQLARYLTTQAENEDIRILDVCGRSHANTDQLREALYSMSLTSELTKSDKGIYHAQLNPAYGEDASMTDEDWMKAADILGHELKLNNQRRVVVLHQKKGRTHAHIAWERYDYEKKKMVPDSFSRLAQDRARIAIEQVFGHKPTPQRNAKRPDMKQALTGLWQKLTKGSEFIKAAKRAGYVVAAGVQRRPFMVVDETGRSFDLVRQLEGIRTKEVRDRLKGERLVSEKDAIAGVRKRQQLAERQRAEAVNDNQAQKVALAPKQQTAEAFAEVRNETTIDKQKEANKHRQDRMERFSEGGSELTTGEQQRFEDRKQKVAAGFATSRGDIIIPKDESSEKKKEELAKGFADTLADIKGKEEQPHPEKKKEAAIGLFAANAKEQTGEQERDRQRRKEAFLASLKEAQEKPRDKGKGLGPEI